jgi:hypothetical protein
MWPPNLLKKAPLPSLYPINEPLPDTSFTFVLAFLFIAEGVQAMALFIAFLPQGFLILSCKYFHPHRTA